MKSKDLNITVFKRFKAVIEVFQFDNYQYSFSFVINEILPNFYFSNKKKVI